MLTRLVQDLPEIYQPIYGHQKLSQKVSRSSADRLKQIIDVHDSLFSLVGRPLKVLDLGCAQGFFSMNLAQRGSIVHGVDFLDKNIAVCNELRLENPGLQVSFETGLIEDIISNLKLNEYDLVLGLSVFHHVIYERGLSEVKNLIKDLSEKCGILILELALREEPLYWADSQPEKPEELIQEIAFVHELAKFGTHLTDIPRPLYLASNRYWMLENHIAEFDKWMTDPHILAQGVHKGTRRYYFSSDAFLKHYRTDQIGEYNKSSYQKELSILKHPPQNFPIATLYANGENEKEAWIVMQRLPGELILDLLRGNREIDTKHVLLSILNQLALLEKLGLYYNDLRTWNVLITKTGEVTLVDYGSISTEMQDCVWPSNLYLSFFVFIREIFTGIIEQPNPLRTVSISPNSLPQPYKSWAYHLWELPISEWSFQLMYDTLLNFCEGGKKELSEKPIFTWMKAIEEALQIQKLSYSQIDSSLARLEAKIIEAECRAMQAESKAIQTEIILQSLLSSKSWKLIAPVRKLANLARWFKSGLMAWILFKPDSRPRRILRSIVLKLSLAPKSKK